MHDADISRRAMLRLAMACTVAGTAALALGCAEGGQQAADDSGQAGTAGQSDGASEAVDSAASPASASAPTKDLVQSALDSLTLQQKVAQMFFVRPESLVTDVDTVIQAGDATFAGMQQIPVGGILLFAKNIIDPDQTRALLSGYGNYSQQLCGLPPFLGVDEEGGTVLRVADNDAFGVSDVGDMCDIGATDDPSAAQQVGDYLASYLVPLGFNVDFAPDADVYDASYNSIMQYRSFGSDPRMVSQMVCAEMVGLEQGGLLCGPKHFPGHGAVDGDSHEGEVVCNKTLEQLQSVDLIPFQAAIDADAPFVMVGHINCPQVSDDGLPASLSPTLVSGLLRQQMAYKGIIITDSMGMGAVDGVYGSAEAAVLAIEAGIDVLLTTPDLPSAYQGVLQAIDAGRIDESRIDESVRRILDAKINRLSQAAGN